ncbi:winged helix-turn-helix domain-containing protein [Streptomyces sp. NPDC002328]|uniref:winged helix-turn-helix domain-containing protein n=1 Tax=Streptomyces sp. NPDC002328 TaxID=3364642 RepID=UPI0036B87305
MTRVLVVEDDPQLVRALVINMQARQYAVDAAPDGATALRLAAARQPDVVMLDLDLLAKKAVRGGHDIRLTPTEWHLLDILVTNPGRLITQKHLLQEVWGATQSNKTNYLRVYMAQLRRKLEADPSHPRCFITEPGMGYRFES